MTTLHNSLARILTVFLVALLLAQPIAAAEQASGEATERLAELEAKVQQEAANKAIVKRWLEELWDQGNFPVAEELLSPDFRRHSEGYPASGPQAYADIVKSCHDGFPDSRIVQVDELIADGDRVFVRWRWTGTHQAEFRGVAATGKAIDVLGEDVIRIKDGRITDIWPLFDPLRLMLQIGAVTEVK